MANMLCHSDDNVVVSAPTGAGKTAVFEMAMARFITRGLVSSHHRGPKVLSPARKMVYLAPSKALCEERYVDWKERLDQLHAHIHVTLITGDSSSSSETSESGCYSDLAKAHLVVTTPEKWDSMTRSWTEHFYLLASVKLVLIDEVHHLGADGSRGLCLEAVVTRCKSIQRAAEHVPVDSHTIHGSRYVCFLHKKRYSLLTD